MKPEIDTLYIYKQKEGSIFNARFKKIDQRIQEGFRFMRNNVPDMAPEVCRYAKTVKVNGLSRTFLMVTLDKNTKKVNAFFNQSVKQIEDDAKLIKLYMSSRQAPIVTPIKYGN